MPLPKLAPELETSIFTTMSALAVRHGAINLGQGFPDSSGPESMLRAANEAVLAGYNQYPPASGRPELRAAIAEQRWSRYQEQYDVDSGIVVCAGATEAMTAAILGTVSPGDEVIVFEPYYDSYVANIVMAGAHRVAVPMRLNGNRHTFDPDELRAAITDRTRAIVVNSPHNPTGTVFTRDELSDIAEVCLQHDLIAITDEVYEYLTYDSSTHIPLATLPGMAERTITCSSAGKTFSVTGWKIGWALGPPDLIDNTRAVKQFLSFASGTPMQLAVAQALRDTVAQGESSWVERLRRDLQDRRDLLTRLLTEAGLPVFPASGTYFLHTDSRAFGASDGAQLCRALPEAAGVAAIPSVVFYDHKEAGSHLVRLAYCKEADTIVEGTQRLINYAKTG